MGERSISSQISYPKSMRARAEKDRKGLVAFDTEDGDCRTTHMGPATAAQIRFARWAAVMCIHLPEELLPDLERMFKSRSEKAKLAQLAEVQP